MAADGARHIDGQIRIEAHPPYPVMVLLILPHLGAAICVWYTSLPLWAVLPASIAVVGSLLATIRRYLRRAAWQLVLSADDRWFILDGRGQSATVEPVAGLFINGTLGLLTIRDGQGVCHPFFLSPCNTDPDTRRRLRVRLRFPKTYRA